MSHHHEHKEIFEAIKEEKIESVEDPIDTEKSKAEADKKEADKKEADKKVADEKKRKDSALATF